MQYPYTQMVMRCWRANPAMVLLLCAAGTLCQAQPPQPSVETKSESAAPKAVVDPRPAIATADQAEREVLMRLLQHPSWVRRAIAILRLERFGCAESRHMLMEGSKDKAWQVRAFALRALVRRGETVEAPLIAEETDPRVVRTALRYRIHFDVDRLGRGVRVLARSSSLEDKMLSVELAAASGDEELIDLARETCRAVILKMDRIEGGVLSPRLAAITSQHDLRRHFEWQRWLLKIGRRFDVAPAFALDEGAGPQPASLIARLESEQFVGVEAYMNALSQKELDLAILLDCTASMYGEIAAAQGGIDDMMQFVSDIVASARIAVVGYRDRSDEWETRIWDFSSDVDQARKALWTLTADGGGDYPEAVFPAMKLAFTQLSWRNDSTKVLVVVGDAPPHVGFGAQCVDMARRAFEGSQLKTHTIEAEGKEVKHFREIAEAGSGRCVALEDDDSLMAEITGLTLEDRYEQEFREFFQVYLELCR